MDGNSGKFWALTNPPLFIEHPPAVDEDEAAAAGAVAVAAAASVDELGCEPLLTMEKLGIFRPILDPHLASNCLQFLNISYFYLQRQSR